MADPHIVDKFTEVGDVAVPTASLGVLWYLDDDGVEGFVWKFDGQIPRTSSIGTLTSIAHALMHEADGDDS